MKPEGDIEDGRTVRGNPPAKPDPDSWPPVVTPEQIAGLNVRALRGEKPLAEKRQPAEYTRPWLSLQDIADQMTRNGFSGFSSAATVSNLERGRRGVPLNELFGLARVFGVSFLTLLYPHGADPGRTRVRVGDIDYHLDGWADLLEGYVYPFGSRGAQAIFGKPPQDHPDVFADPRHDPRAKPELTPEAEIALRNIEKVIRQQNRLIEGMQQRVEEMQRDANREEA